MGPDHRSAELQEPASALKLRVGSRDGCRFEHMRTMHHVCCARLASSAEDLTAYGTETLRPSAKVLVHVFTALPVSAKNVPPLTYVGQCHKQQ